MRHDRYVFEYQIGERRYGFDAELPEELGDELLAGNPVIRCIGKGGYDIPAWIVDCGLAGLWMAASDLWNMRIKGRRLW